MTGKFISTRVSEGTATEHGGLLVTPVSKALIITLPFGRYVLNRPTAIRVEQAETEQMIPLIDVTRVSVIAFLALSAVFTFLSWRVRKRAVKQ